VLIGSVVTLVPQDIRLIGIEVLILAVPDAGRP
jgi:hypothetical protein